MPGSTKECVLCPISSSSTINILTCRQFVLSQLNYNEAVNFAMREWLPQDLESVRKYQSYSKHPVFSHDELLVSIAQNSPTIDTALW